MNIDLSHSLGNTLRNKEEQQEQQQQAQTSPFYSVVADQSFYLHEGDGLGDPPGLDMTCDNLCGFFLLDAGRKYRGGWGVPPGLDTSLAEIMFLLILTRGD